MIINYLLPAGGFNYSVRNDLTGFAMAAFIAWKLTVHKAIIATTNVANTNVHILMLIL